MEAIDIESLIQSLYIDNESSCPVKIETNYGNVIHGAFIKALQFRGKARFNLWDITCLKNIEMILEGEKIVTIEPTTNGNYYLYGY